MIVDDHPVVRDGLNAMISTEPDIQVIGEAGTGQEALAFLEQIHPSIVLMDLLLPDIGGCGSNPARLRETVGYQLYCLDYGGWR